MNEIEFEKKLKQDVEEIFKEIINKISYKINLRALSRAGAELSDIFEKKFVSYFDDKKHKRICNAVSSPKGATKNPYDIKFNYKFCNFNELIWGDIKAFNTNYKDSNPDLGTVNKIIKFMLDGNFYVIYILFQYTPIDERTIILTKFPNSKKRVKVEFLKDIHESFRINPKNQLQVNYNAPFRYRTKKDFILLLERKYKESLHRRLKLTTKKLAEAGPLFEQLKKIQGI